MSASEFTIQIQNRSGFEDEIRRMYPADAESKLVRHGDDYANSTIQALWLGWRLRGNYDVLGSFRP